MTDPRKGQTSASSAPYDALCAGRFLAQQGIPEEESDDAKFGTAVHASLFSGDTSFLDHEQLDIYESCQAIETKIVDRLFGPDRAKAAVFKETRYWVKIRAAKDSDQYHEHSGQPDKIYRLGPRGLVIEYKTLTGDIPESPENLQLRDQVVLAARHLVMNEVMAVVIQPLVTHDPTPCLYDAQSIKQAEEDMFERVRRSHDPKSPRVAGEVQCKFCRAKPVCKEYAKWSAALVPVRIALPDAPVSEWTVEQRVAFCAGYSAVEKWIEENKAAMKVLLKEDPESVPGFHLKPGKTRSSVTDPQALFNRFLELGGTQEQFMACISIGKEKLEIQTKAVTNKGGQALKGQMKKLLDGLVSERQDEPSIAKKK